MLRLGSLFITMIFIFELVAQLPQNPVIVIKRSKHKTQHRQTAPVADFTASNININVGDTIDFYDQSLNSPQLWNWTFSGGSPYYSTDQNPSNIQYNYPGFYDVELTVENSDGSDTKLITNYIVVSSGGTSPAANYQASTNDPIIYQSVQINDFTYNNPSSWQWVISPNTFSFLNGTNSNSQNIELEFYAPGTYTVRMEVTNSYGTDTYEELFYVTQFPCDTLCWIKVPTYEINPIDSPNFSINNYDNDNNMPVQMLIDAKVGSVSGSCDVLGDPCDLYHKIYDGNNNLIYTSTTLDDENPPVWWYYSPIIKTTDQTYKFHVWDDDGSWSNDDDMGYIYFNGEKSSNFHTYTDGNGLSVTLWQYNHGYDYDWTLMEDYWDPDSNYCYGATSYFEPLDQSDNWLTFGPVTIPNEGAELLWLHQFRSNSYRDGYTVHASINGSTINDFLQYGLALKTYADNDSLTQGDVEWTRQNISLSSQVYGGQSVYFGFQHNANDMFALHLDEFIVRGCDSPPVLTDSDPLSDFIVYPVPFKDELIIDSRNNNITSISLYDLSGKMVYSKSGIRDSKIELSLSKISIGQYLLVITTEESVYRELINKSYSQ